MGSEQYHVTKSSMADSAAFLETFRFLKDRSRVISAGTCTENIATSGAKATTPGLPILKSWRSKYDNPT